jgi:hypothetical protein
MWAFREKELTPCMVLIKDVEQLWDTVKAANHSPIQQSK